MGYISARIKEISVLTTLLFISHLGISPLKSAETETRDALDENILKKIYVDAPPQLIRRLNREWALWVQDQSPCLWVVLRSKTEVESYASNFTPYTIFRLQTFFLNDTLAQKVFSKPLNLKFLEIAAGAKVSKISRIIAHCTNLQFLSLSGCSYVTDLPSSISKLQNLKFLNIQGTEVRNFDSLKYITSLQTLYLNAYGIPHVDQIREQHPGEFTVFLPRPLDEL